MTHLVIDLNDIKIRFSGAAAGRQVRVRIIGQTVSYNHQDNHLVVRSISGQGSITVTLRHLVQVNNDFMTKGAVVDVYGLYNGDLIEALDVVSLDGTSITEENIKVMQEVVNS